MSDELLQKWGEKRAVANGIYSIYKDYRDQEESYQSQVEEMLKHKYDLDENVIIEAITAFRKAIDKGTK